MDLKALKEPFPASDIEWRVQRSGERNGKPWAMVLAYVDARAVMDRLDDVCGMDNWKDEYEHLSNGVMCKLSINICEEWRDLATGETTKENICWITKVDGSPETAIEAFKGGISKALVRCAVKWGIGRYLYNLEANFANCTVDKPADRTGWKNDKTKEGTWFYWQPPKLPAWALPKPDEKQLYINDAGNKLSKLTNKFEDKDTLASICATIKIKSFKDVMEFDIEELKDLNIALDNMLKETKRKDGKTVIKI